jgi:hypothetical protein
MAAILGTVRGVDLIVDVVVGFGHEGDVFVEAAGLDVPVVAHLTGAEPGAGAALP